MSDKDKPASAKKQRAEKIEESKDLDQELEDSFPASDPPSMTQPSVAAGAPDHKGEKPKAK